MPSDPRATAALEVLTPAIASFKTLLETTASEVEHRLMAITTSAGDRAGRVARELGPFGARHLDVARLSALLGQPEATNGHTLETVEHALATLRELAVSGNGLHVVDVPEGERLGDAVERALARIGRAFGAARAVASVRSGNYRFADHARSLGAFGFARWTRAERLLAPPLVVQVSGADLSAPVLAEFLDGRVKIALVVIGPCSPAPLARLITPGTFVMQTGDTERLKRLAAFDGPGVAALVPEGCARFVHDPAAQGPRLVVEHMPETAGRRVVGGRSIAQQQEELRLLATLAAASTAPAVPAGAAAAVTTGDGAPPADPAAKLAAWLLAQADLSDVG
jgi:hypothetical protein